MLLPDTAMFAQVRVTGPVVVPVVRPTLLTVWPTDAAPSLEMLLVPVIVSEPRPVFAIPPPSDAVPLVYTARDASLQRHFLPLGQTPPPRKYAGSSTSVPIEAPAAPEVGW